MILSDMCLLYSAFVMLFRSVQMLGAWDIWGREGFTLLGSFINYGLTWADFLLMFISFDYKRMKKCYVAMWNATCGLISNRE